MAFAVNILALIAVLGLCWLAMMWVSGRHRHAVENSKEGLWDLLSGQASGQGPSPLPGDRVMANVSCRECKGVGANHTTEGRITPCGLCQGTGVLS